MCPGAKSVAPITACEEILAQCCPVVGGQYLSLGAVWFALRGRQGRDDKRAATDQSRALHENCGAVSSLSNPRTHA